MKFGTGGGQAKGGVEDEARKKVSFRPTEAATAASAFQFHSFPMQAREEKFKAEAAAKAAAEEAARVICFATIHSPYSISSISPGSWLR
jgi:hypothetical protein